MHLISATVIFARARGKEENETLSLSLSPYVCARAKIERDPLASSFLFFVK